MDDLDIPRMELDYWMTCYASSLAAGKGNRQAKASADQAIIDLRDHMEILSINSGRLGAVVA